MTKIIKWNGRGITMPGIYSGIPLNAYHAAHICNEPSVSSSGLRRIYCPMSSRSYSPAHYWAHSPYNRDAVEDDEAESLVLGRAAHHLLFGEADFRKQFVLRPSTVNGEPWHGNRLVCKAWLDQAKSRGLTVLTTTQLGQIKGIASALAQDPAVRHGVLNGRIEHSWFWKDAETGVWLKVRPDAEPTDSLDYTDLKLTRSVMWRDICRSMDDYGYYQQAALAAEGCLRIHGQPLQSFSFLFVESKPPHCTEFVTIKEHEIKRGMAMNRVAVRKFADCWQAKHWPGPRGDQAEPKPIERSDYAIGQIDQRLSTELGTGWEKQS